MPQRECPKCHGLLEDDGSCSCGYGVKRRSAVIPSKPAGDGLTGQTCAWSDYGRSCPSRGTVSSTTNGSGSWYCREHWERLDNREPDGLGNHPVARTARSLEMRKWDGWVYNPSVRRLERMVEREVGSDDDIEQAA